MRMYVYKWQFFCHVDLLLNSFLISFKSRFQFLYDSYNLKKGDMELIVQEEGAFRAVVIREGEVRICVVFLSKYLLSNPDFSATRKNSAFASKERGYDRFGCGKRKKTKRSWIVSGILSTVRPSRCLRNGFIGTIWECNWLPSSKNFPLRNSIEPVARYRELFRRILPIIRIPIVSWRILFAWKIGSSLMKMKFIEKDRKDYLITPTTNRTLSFMEKESMNFSLVRTKSGCFGNWYFFQSFLFCLLNIITFNNIGKRIHGYNERPGI